MAQNFPPMAHQGPGVTIVIHKGPPPNPNEMYDHAASRLDAANQGGGMQAKGDVNYRAAEQGHACGNCSHFSAQVGETNGTCELVSGSIEANKLCDLWEAQPKPGSASAPPPSANAKGPPPPQK